MVFYNDKTFAAGKVPIRKEISKLLAFPLPVRQAPEPSTPAAPVEIPQWAASGTNWDFYNPISNSFAPTPNFAVLDQLKRQTGVTTNIDHRTTTTSHVATRTGNYADVGAATKGKAKEKAPAAHPNVDAMKEKANVEVLRN